MGDSMSEMDMLKAAVCMKDHELFALRGELDRRIHESQMLFATIERLEKTMAASYDRLIRRLERHGVIELEDRKRRKR